MSGKKRTVSEQMRKAIEQSGMSRYAICKVTGIDKATLSRFMAGRGLSMEALDRLCRFLGLELKPKGKKGR